MKWRLSLGGGFAVSERVCDMHHTVRQDEMGSLNPPRSGGAPFPRPRLLCGPSCSLRRRPERGHPKAEGWAPEEMTTGPGTASRHLITTVTVDVERPNRAVAHFFFVFVQSTTGSPTILNMGAYQRHVPPWGRGVAIDAPGDHIRIAERQHFRRRARHPPRPTSGCCLQ
jgi:hypothetical protein